MGERTWRKKVTTVCDSRNALDPLKNRKSSRTEESGKHAREIATPLARGRKSGTGSNRRDTPPTRDGLSVSRAGARRARGDATAGVARVWDTRARLVTRETRVRGPHRVGPPARAPGAGHRAGPVLRGVRGRGGRPRVPPRRGRAPARRRRARRGLRAPVARGRGRGGTSRETRRERREQTKTADD